MNHWPDFSAIYDHVDLEFWTQSGLGLVGKEFLVFGGELSCRMRFYANVHFWCRFFALF